jgi:hypothetical protein
VVTISRALRLVPAAVLVLGLAACTDDDPGAGKSGPPSSTVGVTEATSTAAETPSVVPATGKVLSVQSVSMRLTDSPDWDVTDTATTVLASLHAPAGGFFDVTVQDVTNLPGRDTEDMAVSYKDSLATEDPAPDRLANRTVDGEECFVLEGRDDKSHRYVVGAVVGERLFLLQFDVPNSVVDGDQMIEQMLASVDIKGA